MKRVLLHWLFFIICLQLLLYLACGDTVISKGGGYKPLLQKKQLNNESNEIVESNGNKRDNSRTVEVVREVLPLNDFQRYKGGSYGGGDLLQPHKQHNGANSHLVNRSPLYFSKIFLHLITGFLISVFHLLIVGEFKQ